MAVCAHRVRIEFFFSKYSIEESRNFFILTLCATMHIVIHARRRLHTLPCTQMSMHVACTQSATNASMNTIGCVAEWMVVYMNKVNVLKQPTDLTLLKHYNPLQY